MNHGSFIFHVLDIWGQIFWTVNWMTRPKCWLLFKSLCGLSYILMITYKTWLFVVLFYQYVLEVNFAPHLGIRHVMVLHHCLKHLFFCVNNLSQTWGCQLITVYFIAVFAYRRLMRYDIKPFEVNTLWWIPFQ
jgi:hypothetical protein